MRWRWRPAAEVAGGIIHALLAEDAAAGGSAARTFPLTGFQEQAVARARRVMDRCGGVVVADDTGLGKTYIALALAEEWLRRGESVVAVVPAGLRGTWTALTRRLVRVKSPGADLHVTTHSRLSRGTHDAGSLARAGLVIVDEAHAFRNPATRRYRALAEGLSRARLMLITATPVNNSLADLYHLVRLFAADDALVDAGVATLKGALLDARAGEAPGEEALRVVGEVMVRRTREEARRWRAGADGSRPAGAEGEAATRRRGGSRPPLRFPVRSPTRLIRYDDPRVPALVDGIERLELATYDGAVDALVRLGLLKRLESSAAALEVSLRRLRGLLAACASAAEAGRLLRPADRRDPGGSGDDDAVQLVLEEMVLAAAPPGTDLAAVGASARRDVETLGGLLRCLAGPDPKLAALRDWATSRPAAQKAVLFTEFRDTAAAIWRALAPAGNVGRVDGGGAWLGVRPAGRRTVLERFAPVSCGVDEPPARERVDLLVATDVLSEGLNLQDAGVVVCYDLPWNPVRILQRIGRVDRLGCLQPEVQPILFVPGQGLDAVLRLTRVLRHKLGGIAVTTGADRAGELLALLGGREVAEPLDRIAAVPGRGATDGDGRGVRRRLEELLARSGPTPPLRAGPPALGLTSGSGAEGTWLVLVRHRNGRPELLRIEPGGTVAAFDEDTLAALGAALQAEPRPEPPLADGERHRLEERAASVVRSAMMHLRGRTLAGRAPAPLHGGSPEARLGRRIRAVLATLGPAPEPHLLRRADVVLGRLSRPLGPSARARIGAFLCAGASDPGAVPLSGPPDFPQFLERVEAVLVAPAEAGGSGPSGGRTDHREAVVLAVLGVGNTRGGDPSSDG